MLYHYIKGRFLISAITQIDDRTAVPVDVAKRHLFALIGHHQLVIQVGLLAFLENPSLARVFIARSYIGKKSIMK